MKRILFLVLAVFPSCGFYPIPESAYVATEDMQFAITASDSGNDAKLAIGINSPAGSLQMTEGDKLTARVDGNLVPLTFFPGTFASYRTDLAVINTDIVIDLDRPTERSIQDLTLAMPPMFTVTVEDPVGSAPIVITWDPAPLDPAAPAFTTSVTIKGECLPLFSRILTGDTGTVTIEQSDLQLTNNGITPCALEVEFTRTATPVGNLFDLTINAKFSATLKRYRVLKVNLNP